MRGVCREAVGTPPKTRLCFKACACCMPCVFNDAGRPENGSPAAVQRRGKVGVSQRPDKKAKEASPSRACQRIRQP